jgi:hypothetical protein
VRQLSRRLLCVLVGACVAAPAAPAGRVAHAGVAATTCTFTGARWIADGRTGNEYDITVLRGVDCSQATALARALTKKRSQGPDTRLAAPGRWFCLSFVPRNTSVSRGGCAKLGKVVMWAPRGGEPVRRDAKEDKPRAYRDGGGRDKDIEKRGRRGDRT